MSKGSDSQFEFDKALIGALVTLCLVPPVGVILLINRFRKFGRSKKQAQELSNMGITAFVVSLFQAFLGFSGFAALTGLCGIGIFGLGYLSKKKGERYRRYLTVIRGRSPIFLTEIAAKTDQSVATVEKDLQDMIDKGFFGLDTFIDHNRKCIVLDGVDDYNWADSAKRDSETINININVEEFVKKASDIFHDVSSRASASREKSRPRQHEAPVHTAPEEKPAAAKPEAKPAGDDQFGRTISQIRELNDRIADPVISAKIDQIEGITTRIFTVVRKKPERIGEIRKFMNYYLPTTLKLLDSYAMLEEQGIEGDNITASKEQISHILDTLIVSFKKQLDLLFSSQAMDISSDIEVMENMLAADGLKDSDFRINRPQGGH